MREIKSTKWKVIDPNARCSCSWIRFLAKTRGARVRHKSCSLPVSCVTCPACEGVRVKFASGVGVCLDSVSCSCSCSCCCFSWAPQPRWCPSGVPFNFSLFVCTSFLCSILFVKKDVFFKFLLFSVFFHFSAAMRFRKRLVWREQKPKMTATTEGKSCSLRVVGQVIDGQVALSSHADAGGLLARAPEIATS